MKDKADQGYTLMELLIVIAILGVIAAFAYSSYMGSTNKARRTDAKNALLDAASQQEKWYMQFNQYTDDVNNIGGSSSKDGYYSISVVFNADTQNSCDDGACFTLTATPVSGKAQAKDSDCAVFEIDNLGRKVAEDSGGNSNSKCWN